MSDLLTNYYQASILNELEQQRENQKSASEAPAILKYLEEQGTLKAAYSWNEGARKYFDNKGAMIRSDFYRRHPEIKDKHGEFKKHFPKKYFLFTTLDTLASEGRITPDEYLVFAKEIYNF